MKKAIINFFVMQLIIILLAPCVLSNSYETYEKIIYVDDSGGADYTKIQDAIDNASTGDTIIVYNGTYYENIEVNKKLEIIGCGDSNIVGIDETQGKPVVLINMDGVKLSNFIIQGFFDGINIYYINDCEITNNQIINNERGIFLIESFDNVISNNIISYNSKYGVMLQRCAHDHIISNEFSSNEGTAIYILDAANNEINYNNFRDNRINAFVLNSPVNYWEGNYWDRPRVLPKIIFGLRTIIPWINLDLHPSREPNEI